MKRNCVWALLLALAVSMLTACSSTEENVDAILTLLGVDSEEEYSEAEAAEDIPFDETGMYAAIEDIIEENFDQPNSLEFDRDEQALNFYVEAPENTRSMLSLDHPEIMESWAVVRTNTGEMCSRMWELVEVFDGVKAVNVYVVDELNSGNRYTVGDYLLWYENGDLIYEYEG